MGKARKTLTYLIAGLAIIALHYALPYTALSGGRGFELYAFWAVLASAWLAATLAYLRRW
ncbi:MAG: hypothetical protein J7L55_05180 [Desulfurococcales archaeon]|nr:hypothetical protein [Desulfurococcales archaeon]